MKTPTMYDIVLDKYEQRLNTVYDALEELKGIMKLKEWEELHNLYQEGALGGTDLEERVELTYGNFNSLAHGVVDVVTE